MGAVGGGIAVITQIPTLPSGDIETRSVAHQAEQIIQNYISSLALIGASLDDILHVTVYLVDIDEAGEFRSVWNTHFPHLGPGRAIIGVADLGHPSIRVETTAIIARPQAQQDENTAADREESQA